MTPSEQEVLDLLQQAKVLAQRYRALTGKPQGITGEVAEYEAARILGAKLTPARQAGYDATEVVNGVERRLQIKGRCFPRESKKSQQLGSIDITKEFAVLAVLVDENFDAYEVHEADEDAVVAALVAPGSVGRNVRGALAVSQFTKLGRLRWRG